MGLLRVLCGFIAFEQLIFCNIHLIRSSELIIASNGYFREPYTWVQLGTSILQILVTCILAQGLLERKLGKFVPWLIVNAGFILISTVITIVGLFNARLMAQFFGMSNPILHIALLMVVAMQWICWIVVGYYYRHLRLKALKLKENKDAENSVPIETTEKPTEPGNKTVASAEQSTPVQSQGWENPQPHVLYHSQKMEDNVPLTRMYPTPKIEENVPLTRMYPTPKIEENVPMTRMYPAQRMEENMTLNRLYPSQNMEENVPATRLYNSQKMDEIMPSARLYPTAPPVV